MDQIDFWRIVKPERAIKLRYQKMCQKCLCIHEKEDLYEFFEASQADVPRRTKIFSKHLHGPETHATRTHTQTHKNIWCQIKSEQSFSRLLLENLKFFFLLFSRLINKSFVLCEENPFR